MEDKSFFTLIQQPSLFFLYFSIIDGGEELALPFFRSRGLRVRILRRYRQEGDRYKMLICRVRKRDGDRFVRLMEAFSDKMALCGYPDYRRDCDQIWQEFRRLPGGEDLKEATWPVR